jgi:hypothetical protein
LPEWTYLETAVILAAIVEARLRDRCARSAKCDRRAKRDQQVLAHHQKISCAVGRPTQARHESPRSDASGYRNDKPVSGPWFLACEPSPARAVSGSVWRQRRRRDCGWSLFVLVAVLWLWALGGVMYGRGTVRLFVAMLGLLDIVGGRGAEDEVVSEVATDACGFGRDGRGRKGEQRGAKAQKHFHVRFRPFGQPVIKVWRRRRGGISATPWANRLRSVATAEQAIVQRRSWVAVPGF